jgi:hypothetical protein
LLAPASTDFRFQFVFATRKALVIRKRTKLDEEYLQNLHGKAGLAYQMVKLQLLGGAT